MLVLLGKCGAESDESGDESDEDINMNYIAPSNAVENTMVRS